jgi:hypothetical protein
MEISVKKTQSSHKGFVNKTQDCYQAARIPEVR